jgi:hypothetical protein
MPTTFCRQIKTNGRRCCSPALRGKAFCYYHAKSNVRLRSVQPQSRQEIETIIHSMQLDRDRLQREPLTAEYYGIKPSGPLLLDFPALDDRESIQVALSMLIAALGHNQIDAKRAAPILYGLQVASSNAKSLSINRQRESVVETTVDESGNEIALDEDPIEIVEFNEWIEARRREEAEEQDEDSGEAIYEAQETR